MRKKARQGRKARKRASSGSATRLVPPRTVEAFFAMPMHFQEVYASVTQAISRMRNDRVSLSRAAQEFGVGRRHIQRFGGSALRKGRNGRYLAKKRDSLLRVLLILTRHGVVEIGITDSGQASTLGEYWNAVHRYLSTGDDSRLVNFRGKHIADAHGEKFPLLTDREELDRLGSAGVLSFESLYARAA